MDEPMVLVSTRRRKFPAPDRNPPKFIKQIANISIDYSTSNRSLVTIKKEREKIGKDSRVIRQQMYTSVTL